MKKNEFIDDFKKQFTEDEISLITMETNFRKLDSWDSLTALSILLMIKEEYKVEISDIELKNCQTINDIFNIISTKQ